MAQAALACLPSSDVDVHDLTLILPLYLSEHVYSRFLAPLLNSKYLQLSKYLTELSDAGHIFGAGVG